MYNTTAWRQACDRAKEISIEEGRCFITGSETDYLITLPGGVDKPPKVVIAEFVKGKRVAHEVSGRRTVGINRHG